MNINVGIYIYIYINVQYIHIYNAYFEQPEPQETAAHSLMEPYFRRFSSPNASSVYASTNPSPAMKTACMVVLVVV